VVATQSQQSLLGGSEALQIDSKQRNTTMTTKFKPFDPTTAKNGDTLYGVLSGNEYIYIGKAHVSNNASVIYDVKAGEYFRVFDKHLQVAVPKRTVWINLCRDGDKHGVGYFYPTEDEAVRKKMTNSLIGTYAIEIDAE
jgi:hypothetical protein